MTSRNKAVLWVLGVFLTGAVFGGAIGYFAVRPPMPPPGDPEALFAPGPDDPEPGRPEPGQVDRPTDAPPVEPGEGPRGFGGRPGGPPGGRPGDQRGGPAQEMRRLARFLQLTPDQYGQLRQILAQAMQRYQAANTDHRLRQRQIRSDMMHSLRAILTPEQKQRLDGFLDDRRQNWRHQQDRRRGNQPDQ